ncbi:kinase-like domain-containing protein [Trametes maxima]|nr:kinase-like domain-containing protein [Trametes maxima]
MATPLSRKAQGQSLYGELPGIHMNTAKGMTMSIPDVRMATAKGMTMDKDIRMDTAKSNTTIRGGHFKVWEHELLDSPEVRRKATVAQLYFLDYYFQLLGYISNRKERRARFDEDTAKRQLTQAEYAQEFKSYRGRERALLRKRRVKLRVDQFQIIAQVGQGGYGEVFLARKADTREVCALKKMRKRTLFKMDEVRHVLVERDILTATKTPWLVRLLYAFQDPQHVYLVMEYVPGGDFRTLLNNAGVLKEEITQFYISEMFVAVNELHKLGYIHRDLKPEVYRSRHVKLTLTDFGLATGALNPQRIESLKVKLDKVKDNEIILCSTLERRSIYRSMRQAIPRYADSIWTSVLQRPDQVFTDLTDITKLIAHASVRYATLSQVREHGFFKGMHWDDLRAVDPPYVPELTGEDDTGYYDDFTSPKDMQKYAEVIEKWCHVERVREKEEPAARGVWVGFTFRKNGPLAIGGGGGGRAFGGEDDGALAMIF